MRSVLQAQRATFEHLGCIVEDACPDLRGADEVFLTLRAWRSWNTLGPLLEKHRAEMKPEADLGDRVRGKAERFRHRQRDDPACRNHGADAAVSGEVRVHALRGEPGSPFDATIDWPKEIEGTTMEHYIAWMKSAYWITVTFCPAISVPAGFTPEGWPVGIQIVGRYRDDLGVLQDGPRLRAGDRLRAQAARYGNDLKHEAERQGAT